MPSDFDCDCGVGSSGGGGGGHGSDCVLVGGGGAAALRGGSTVDDLNHLIPLRSGDPLASRASMLAVLSVRFMRGFSARGV